MTDLSAEGRERLRGFAAKCSDHDPCCSIWPENRSVKLECDCHFAAIREAVPALLDRIEQLEELVSHCWVHSGYQDCGSQQMTTKQRALYEEIIAREPD